MFHERRVRQRIVFCAMVALRRDIMSEAGRLRLPAVYAQGEVPRQGGLVSYGADRVIE